MKIKKIVEEPVMEEPVVEEVKEPVVEERLEEPEYYFLGTTETLEDVARKFNTTVERLKEINGELSASNQMRVR